MRTKLLTAGALAAAAAIAVPGAAMGGGGDAETKVTIKAPGSEVYGFVKSPRPNRCANDRLVKVFQQKGRRGGGNDILRGSDSASPNGDRYMWSIGNPGLQGKKIYAKAPRIPGCEPDSSRTIVAGA
jgi:hypothetical protein